MRFRTLQPFRGLQTLRKRSRESFSAAELLVVVAMLAILAAVSLPLFARTLSSSRLSGAARQIAGETRSARSLAISRGGFYGLHSGRDPLILDPLPPNLSRNSYRIEYSADGATWPSVTATPGSDPAVITNWMDLSREFTGVQVLSVQNGGGAGIGGPIFNAIGASVDTTNTVRTVRLTLDDGSSPTKVIEVNPAGNVKIP